MRRNPAIWLLCLSLVLTRLMGLHAHACAGIDLASHQHEAAHFADSGLLFGEAHQADHGDNLELDLTVAIPAAKLPFDVAVDPALPGLVQTIVPLEQISFLVRMPRGPPSVLVNQTAHFTPPPRGPPADSFA